MFPEPEEELIEDPFWQHSLDIEERKVYFFDEVTTESTLRCVKSLAFLDKTEGKITLMINSDGGNIIDGWAIVDFIKNMKNEVHGMVYGGACSMASVILQACKTRTMSRHSIMLIHSGSATLDGEMNSIFANSDYLKRDLEKTMDFYRARAKISHKKMKEFMSTDTLLDASEALRYGFIDMVLE